MNKKHAEKLLGLVNSKSNMDALVFYTDLRIDYLKEQLVNASTIEDVRRFQGAIEELKRFKTLREEVNNPRD
jgi:hypothetical protein